MSRQSREYYLRVIIAPLPYQMVHASKIIILYFCKCVY
jgi:hypothetical protein